ncbi:MAG TPA: M1 family metallopeptidase [Kofleriaceae bacterium]|nr:M1 family metallopeptidase [Kofleriaceae bacterium]
MKRAWIFFLAMVAGCGGGLPAPATKPLPKVDGHPALLTPGVRSPRIASYRIEASFDPAPDKRRIVGKLLLTWKNAGTAAVTKLPFHLYMNAFKNADTVFMRESRGHFRTARANDNGWGWIKVSTIRINGGDDVRAEAKFVGDEGPGSSLPRDETVLEVPLATPIAGGQTATIAMTFEVKLPIVWARTGMKGAFAMAGQWFPKIGVRTGEPGTMTWECAPFHAMSEFFADFGTYDVTLTVPDTHVVAATGVLVAAEDLPGPTRRLTYHAEDVHDFAWMADPYMERIAGQAKTALGEVEVVVFARPAQRAFARRHLAAGIGAIESYSALYAPYPWSKMTIIDPPPDAMAAGGMEYPTLVTTAADHALAKPGFRLPEFVTVHEVGHNWFQGMLASNEVEDAWLDEGINTYTNQVVMEKLYGPGWLDGYGLHTTRMDLAGAMVPDTSVVPIATPSYGFPTSTDYGLLTYFQTGRALLTLENLVGRDRFRKAMGEYARAFAFTHPRPEDFFSSLEKSLGQDLDWFVKPAFFQRGRVGLEVRDITCKKRKAGGQRCDIDVANTGTVPVPFEVKIELADGSTLEKTADGKNFWHRFSVDVNAPVALAILDPDHKIMLNDNATERARHATRRGGAARRFGAGAQNVAQTAMQVLGL